MKHLSVLFLVAGLFLAAIVLFSPAPVKGGMNTSLTAGVGTPVLDGVESPGEWTSDSIVTSRGVTIKAMMDLDNFYVLATWPDSAPSVSLDHWTWDGQQWSASEDEDRISFIWDMVDAQGNSLNGDDGPSCVTMCHPGEGMATRVGRVDVWHAKTTRFLPVGYTDDKYWVPEPPNGRRDDQGSGSGDRNRNEAQTGPVYGPPNFTFLTEDQEALDAVNTYGSSLGTAAVKVLLDGSEQFQAGDTIAGRILDVPTGNRATVKSVGTWANGAWTVEFCRKLAGEVGPGGMPEDFTAVPGGSVRFTTDIFDNLSEHANHSFSQAGISGGADFTIYTLNFANPDLVYFAQFGNGGGFTSDTVLTNPSDINTAAGTIDFTDGLGDPLPIGIAAIEGDAVLSGWVGLQQETSVDFAIPPLGSVTISTDGVGDVVAGSAKVTADNPVGGVIRFNIPGIGIAGVGESAPLERFIAPVRRQVGGINTGIAIRNTTDQPVTIQASLRDQTGTVVTNGQTTIEDFPANGHLARFINDSEWFPDADTDDFVGTVVVEVEGGKVAATVLELGENPGEFTTLPVTALP